MIALRWLPWMIFGLTSALLGAAVLIGEVSADPVGIAVAAVFVLGNGAVGALVASRRGHLVGWLLLASGLCFASGGLLVTHAEQSLTRSLPLSPVIFHAGSWSFTLGILAALLVLLYFPTASLPSPRWRPFTWISILGTLMLIIAVSLSSDSFEGYENPWALPPDDPRTLIFEGGGPFLLLIAMLGAVGSIIVRLRIGDETEKRQLKWVMFAVLVAVLGILGIYVIELANGPAEISDDLENMVVTLGLALVPIAIGLAIFRYRLYEIDRIISRTVTYAVVASLLGLVVLGLMAGLALFLPSEDPLVVAVATLVVFALFNPVRRRVQGWVDRRFNRSRYDAARVIGTFTEALREQVDPNEVVDDWVGVVEETMQPTSVGVWVRD